jgi:predicted  nucleic acid-binding Zn-ribbon protein
MQDEVQVRLDALRKEMEIGQQRMQDLERQLSQLRDTMLRISGAIQVLEELQAQAAPPATPDQATGENKLVEPE